MFTAGVKLIDLDSTGRMLLPKDLQKYAKINREIVLSSSGSMIEIWDNTKYESIINNAKIDFASLAEDVMGFKDFNDE